MLLKNVQNIQIAKENYVMIKLIILILEEKSNFLTY